MIAASAVNKESSDFRVLEWNGAPGSALRAVTSYPRALKPEGITRARIGERSVNVVVFDTSRFALLD